MSLLYSIGVGLNHWSALFFSVESQIINIIDFMAHKIFVTTTQLYSCSMKTAIDDTQINKLLLCANKTTKNRQPIGVAA